MPVVHEYSSKEMLRLVKGLTYRQIDYWCTTGLLQPSAAEGKGRGSSRRFFFADLITARVLIQMKSYGFSLQQLRKVSAAISKNRNTFKNPLVGQKLVILPDEKGQDLAVSVFPQARFKPADGTDMDTIESVLNNPGQTMSREIVLPLQDTVEPLKVAAAELVAERKKQAALLKDRRLAADAARNARNRERAKRRGAVA